MKIHLIKTEKVNELLLEQVAEIIHSVPGPIQVVSHNTSVEVGFNSLYFRTFETREEFERKEEDINIHEVFVIREVPEEILTMKWEQIWAICKEYRQINAIPKDEMIVLLMDMGNEFNWFSAVDPKGENIGFIQTSFWGHYFDSDSQYPISYQLAIKPLLRLIAKDQTEFREIVHDDPRGCVSDMCMDKKQITLKMRTADICPDCLDVATEKNIDKQLILQVFKIMEGIRKEMTFKQRLNIDNKPSRIEINGRNLDLHLIDMNNKKINLNPQEKTIFLLHLLYAEGLSRIEVSEKYEEVQKLYNHLSVADSKEANDRAVQRLVDLQDRTLSVKVSSIKKKLSDALGEELASLYCIKGPNGGKKNIELDRNYVVGINHVRDVIFGE